MRPHLSRWAVFAMSLGVGGLLIAHETGAFALLPGFTAVIIGRNATKDIRASEGALYGEGAAAAGVLFGGLAAFVGLFCI